MPVLKQSFMLFFVVLVLFVFATPSLASQVPMREGTVPSPMGTNDLCARLPFVCKMDKGDIPEEWSSLLKRVNQEVNRQVAPVFDMRLYGVDEYWTLPKGRGDCEDYALLKKQRLIEAGYPAFALRIATVLDGREAHAVLVVATPEGDKVLDNLTGRIKSWDKTGYFFLRIQDKSRIGGWRGVLRDAHAR